MTPSDLGIVGVLFAAVMALAKAVEHLAARARPKPPEGDSGPSTGKIDAMHLVITARDTDERYRLWAGSRLEGELVKLREAVNRGTEAQEASTVAITRLAVVLDQRDAL